MRAFVVHKFGGTSVKDAERYENVAKIVAGLPEPRAIVVSAMSGVTDALHALVDGAKKRDASTHDRLRALIEKHKVCIRALFGDSEGARALVDMLEADARALQDLIRATELVRSASETLLEFVAGHGELWSAAILTGLLKREGIRAITVDAREVIVVEHVATGPRIHWDESKERMQGFARGHEDTLVVTGYIARTPDGAPTTLKRNGSDFSASIIGALLEASEIVIWTDVDGVLSADPKKVPEAVVTPELSYAEAAELAYFGAKVLHPHTMAPAIKAGIPIWIKNSFAPEKPGSCIRASSEIKKPTHDRPVRGFASIDGVALLNVEGTGMIGVPGVAERLFRALRDVDVNVILISQASSEHSICVGVPQTSAARAKEAVSRAFAPELTDGLLSSVDVIAHCGVLAAVGEGMAETPGVSGRLFSALSRSGVNVRAVAQGSSERNISVVVDEADLSRALRAAHAGFYLSDQTLSVGLIGPGGIGRALLDQLHAQRELLKREFNVDLRVRGIARSSSMVLGEPEIPLSSWATALVKGEPLSMDRFIAHLSAPHLPHRVIIDCTASDDVAGMCERFLAAGIHVITPNKKAESGPLARWHGILEAKKKSGAHFFREATVGAGLPILSTLTDLLRTGDKVTRIEGILSGTLSYLFNTYDATMPWSALVREARTRGFTEPDPRDDLGGTDFARKLVILARELSLSLSLSDVKIESLVPQALVDVKPVDAFLDGLKAYDDEMAKLYTDAREQGMALRYMGSVDPVRGIEVGLRRIPLTHPFARVTGTDNIIAFTTTRYATQPLVVQGPGAGPEVTAGGVFSDLLRLASHLGARS
jgi:aspartokinase/homoserine dehydrogenase 1